MTHQIKAVGFDIDADESLALRARADILASQLNLIVDNQVFPRLSIMADKLVLLIDNFLPLFVDFSSVMWKKRRDAGKKQGLVRACKPAKGLRILDATAGWGRDSAVLASFGAEVLMLERQPMVAALLADGLSRMLDEPTAPLGLSLFAMDATHYLQTLIPADYPDVIYIDPMHPLRQKSALVKKDMQALQQIIGADNDARDLIALAITRARQRVVVKWPERLAPLLPPTVSIGGKTVRFDVYI
jgi:16S rRNA (guanine1516-N2)-methyltransferase